MDILLILNYNQTKGEAYYAPYSLHEHSDLCYSNVSKKIIKYKRNLYFILFSLISFLIVRFMNGIKNKEMSTTNIRQ